MLAFALAGLVANTVSLGLLAGRRGESLNMRGAFLEVLSDLVGSCAVVVAALTVLVADVQRADPIATLLIEPADITVFSARTCTLSPCGMAWIALSRTLWMT